MQPLVSVLIPVYNGAELLSRALDSVYEQSFREFEVIVLDDGSSDRSSEVAERYPARVIRQENRGIGATRQRLVEEAQGEWVAFLDHDDWWEPRKLEAQWPLTREASVGLIHTGFGFVFPDGAVQVPPAPQFDSTMEHVLPDCRINTCSTLIRRDAILKAGGFESTSAAEDWLMWVRLAAGWDFAYVPETLTWTLKRPGSASAPRSSWYDGERRVLDEVSRDLDRIYSRYPAEIRQQVHGTIKRKLAAIASLQGEAFDREGRKVEARVRHLEALRQAPSMKGAWLRAAKHVTGISRRHARL